MDVDGYHYLGKSPDFAPRVVEKMMKERVEVANAFAKVDAGDVRYDLLLLALLDEVAIRWPAIDTSKIFLVGFSGGGQFVHRFMYLHPERVMAASIGAPGNTTAPDFEKAWPAGLKDAENIFGKRPDLESLKQIKTFFSVGGEDNVSSAGKLARLFKGDAFGSEEEADKTRVQRTTELVQQWRDVGVDVEFEIVPGAKHEMEKVNVAVLPFMEKQIKSYWGE
jgi:dienelactone hydrolase